MHVTRSAAGQQACCALWYTQSRSLQLVLFRLASWLTAMSAVQRAQRGSGVASLYSQANGTQCARGGQVAWRRAAAVRAVYRGAAALRRAPRARPPAGTSELRAAPRRAPALPSEQSRQPAAGPPGRQAERCCGGAGRPAGGARVPDPAAARVQRSAPANPQRGANWAAGAAARAGGRTGRAGTSGRAGTRACGARSARRVPARAPGLEWRGARGALRHPPTSACDVHVSTTP